MSDIQFNSHSYRNNSIILAIARASTPDDSVKLSQDAALRRRAWEYLDGTTEPPLFCVAEFW